MRLVSALSLATLCLTSSAYASNVDPIKLASDPLAQKTLEVIDANHQLHSLGTIAKYVLMADIKRDQACALTDKDGGVYLLDCAASKNNVYKHHALLLNDENGRLLVLAMYNENNKILDSDTSFDRITSISPTEPDAVNTKAAVPPAKASSEDDFLPGMPNSSDLSNITDVDHTEFWAPGSNQQHENLGTEVGLNAAVHRKGGRCVIGPYNGASEIVCRFPNATNPSPDAADELTVDLSESPLNCSPGNRECDEVRDIKLNDKRWTHAAFTQFMEAGATESTTQKPSDSSPKDLGMFTYEHNQMQDMGSIVNLDAWLHQIQGQCFIAEEKPRDRITCTFPDAKTHRTHTLYLEGERDGDNNIGVNVSKLDGKFLPYHTYAQLFLNHP